MESVAVDVEARDTSRQSVAPASTRKARATALQARAARTGRAARAARARANTNGPVSATVVVSGDMDPGTVGPSSATRRTTVVVAKEEESVTWTME